MLELISWENATSSAFGMDGQNVVNSQIGDDYDAMIALFWHRLGSPINRDVSGTAEEYGRALQRAKDGKPIKIGVYFKSSNPPMAEIDPVQLQGVFDLRTRMQNDGIYHKNFVNEDGLAFEIDLFLDKLVRSHQSGVLNYKDDSLDQKNLRLTGKDRGIKVPDDELGYLDLVDSIAEHSGRMARFLAESSGKLGEITAATQEGGVKLLVKWSH